MVVWPGRPNERLRAYGHGTYAYGVTRIRREAQSETLVHIIPRPNTPSYMQPTISGNTASLAGPELPLAPQGKFCANHPSR